MTNDEINRRVAEIMEPKPSDKPNGAFVAHMGGVMYSSGWAWKYDIDAEAPAWQPLDFCTSIAAAWKCVEWAKEARNCKTVVARQVWDSHDDEDIWKWVAEFGAIYSDADTAPLAICLAFLAAFGGEQ